MSATINTFPPFQSMNSPRGWILAVIVLLHLGFFWALSTSMGQQMFQALKPRALMVDIPIQQQPDEPPQPMKYEPKKFDQWRIFVPEPDPRFQQDDETQDSIREIPKAGGETGTAGDSDDPPLHVPQLSAPEIDPRVGLSEPVYPPSEIRAGHTGTALVSVRVLENGRVGEVRLDQSSGWAKLDESALREARRWRFKPGMRDGVAVSMWKQVPITFQLQDRSR